jgi:hypothetical protein
VGLWRIKNIDGRLTEEEVGLKEAVDDSHRAMSRNVIRREGLVVPLYQFPGDFVSVNKH